MQEQPLSYRTSNRITRTMIHQIQVNGLSNHQNADLGIPFISQTSFPASPSYVNPTSSLRLPRGARLGKQCLQIPQDCNRGGKCFSRVSPVKNPAISRAPLHILRTERQYSTRRSDTQLENARMRTGQKRFNTVRGSRRAPPPSGENQAAPFPP